MNLLYQLRVPMAFALIAALFFFLTIQAGPSSPKGTITAEVAPEGATISIDGREMSSEVTVETGDHTVEAKMDGFATQSQQVDLKEGQTLKVGFVLESNSPETADWYTEHPEDQQLAEVILGQLSDFNTESAIQTNPLLQQLPYSYSDGNSGFVNIDHGVPVKGSSQPAIYVSARTPLARQEAVAWIRSQGYDPTTMDIIFKGEVNPFRGQTK